MGGPRCAGSVGMSSICPVMGSLASWYPMGMGPGPGPRPGGGPPAQGEGYGGMDPGGPGGHEGGGPLDHVLGPIPWDDTEIKIS